MWSLQDSSSQERALRWIDSGIIEGWHGDGNFARTTLMHCLWKTEGLTIEPWRKDVVFGAKYDNGILYVSLEAGEDWEGSLNFGVERHRTILNLPVDYPRINQFPEWYTVRDEAQYKIENSQDLIISGYDMKKGLDIMLDKNKPYLLKLSEVK